MDNTTLIVGARYRAERFAGVAAGEGGLQGCPRGEEHGKARNRQELSCGVSPASQRVDLGDGIASVDGEVLARSRVADVITRATGGHAACSIRVSAEFNSTAAIP